MKTQIRKQIQKNQFRSWALFAPLFLAVIFSQTAKGASPVYFTELSLAGTEEQTAVSSEFPTDNFAGVDQGVKYWIRLDLGKGEVALGRTQPKTCSENEFCGEVVSSKQVVLPLVRTHEDNCGVVYYVASEASSHDDFKILPVKGTNELQGMQVDFQSQKKRTIVVSDYKSSRCGDRPLVDTKVVFEMTEGNLGSTSQYIAEYEGAALR